MAEATLWFPKAIARLANDAIVDETRVIDAADFIDEALGCGLDFWTGVPCSFLTPFIDAVGASDRLDYVGAVNEGDAIGIAAGAHLVGRGTVVMFQNSGFGNAVNPLTSLSDTFRIPTLLIVTHRGAPGLKPPDEPQHERMGAITEALLDTLGVRWETFPQRRDEIAPCLARAAEHMCRQGRPYALVMKKGSVAGSDRKPAPVYLRDCAAPVAGTFEREPSERMRRTDALELIRTAVAGQRPILASTGKLGRELFAMGHRVNQFYMVGSMGCAASIGLGVCAGGLGHGAVVVDGDGALLMRMGAMATIGHYAPERMVHIVLDNEAHESTGGQATVSAGVDFATIAAACGYTSARRVDCEADLASAVEQALVSEGPHFVHVKVALGSAPDLPRPDRNPAQFKEELMAWLSR